MTLVYEFCIFATKSSCPKSFFRVCQASIMGLGKANPTASLGGTGVPFPKEKASISPTAWCGIQSQEGLLGKQGRTWEKPTDPFPWVCRDLASTTDLLLMLPDSQLRKNQGKALVKLSRTAASCLTVFWVREGIEMLW